MLVSWSQMKRTVFAERSLPNAPKQLGIKGINSRSAICSAPENFDIAPSILF